MVNGAPRDVEGTSLSEVLEELGFQSAVVATALNEVFVARAHRSAAVVSEGDRLEVLAPMQGG